MTGDAYGPRSRRSGRAALRLAALGASIAIAGCGQATVKNNGECIYIPTGERFTVRAGDSALYSGGQLILSVHGADGFTREITNANAEHWKCRSLDK